MCKNLEKQFEEIREKLNSLSKTYGLNHPDVLRLSKRLDKIHLEILKEQKKGN